MFKVMHVKSHRSLYLEPLDKSHRTSTLNRTAAYICRYLYLYLYRYLSRVFCGFCGHLALHALKAPLSIKKPGAALGFYTAKFPTRHGEDAEGGQLSVLGPFRALLEGDIHCHLNIFQRNFFRYTNA